jgi:nucleoside transporter
MPHANNISARIAVLMFLHHFAFGAWFVSLGVYMSKALGFDSIIGAAYGMAGIGAIASSLFVGVVADRFFAAQRLIGILYLIAGISIVAVSSIQVDQTFFLAALLFHFVFMMATTPLSVSIAFSHLPEPAKQFPAIRAAGTLGWIVAGLTIGLWRGSAMTAGPMQLAGVVYLICGLYAFTLPHTQPKAKGQPITLTGLFGLDILKGNRDRLLWIFIIGLVLAGIPKKFYDSLLNNFLVEKGVVLHAFGITLESTGVQTLGQVIEALTLLVLPWVIARFGIKWVMVIGMAAWCVRYLLFAFGFDGNVATLWMILLGIFMHGLCYDFFFISGQIWFDQRFEPAMRSRAQSLFNFLLSGTGVFLGANIAGVTYKIGTVAKGVHDWQFIWLVPASITFAVMLYFLALFKEQRSSAASL